MPYVTVRHTCGSARRASGRGRASRNVRSTPSLGTRRHGSGPTQRHESRGIHDMSAMRKMGVYLGLLEDAEGDYADTEFDEPPRRTEPRAEQEPARPVANLAERRRPVREPQGRPTTTVAPMSRITT